MKALAPARHATLDTRLARPHPMLGTARSKAAIARGAQRAHVAGLNAKAAPDKPLADLEFSHGGYVISITPRPDGDTRGGRGSRQVLRKGRIDVDRPQKPKAPAEEAAPRAAP
jgi:hypothetical protein